MPISREGYEELFTNQASSTELQIIRLKRTQLMQVIGHVVKIKFAILANINRNLRVHLCSKNNAHENVTHVISHI